jgi:aryl-phospho-beta-D-glucosidase BglC (GH1 family)
LSPGQDGGVPKDLLASLKTGVNITRWFCYLPGQNLPEHYQTYFTDADFAELDKLKVGFVRLCITPDQVDRNGSADSATLEALDVALGKLMFHGLTVIWDLHDNGQLKLDQPGIDTSKFTDFWMAIAARYKGRFERRLVFELLNEPQFTKDPAPWFNLQEKTVEAIRAVDPLRTIMVSSTRWSGVDAMELMKPLPEKNLLYTFHCYDPFFFTHQGASWVGEYPRNFKNIPFPATPEAVAAILPSNDEKYKDALIDYGKQGYDDAYLEKRLATCMDWGKRNGVPMVLGEFGAYPLVSPPDSRARWFEGMRKAIDKLGVPNAIWGYDDALGLGRSVNADGTLKLDPVTLGHFYNR